MNRNNSQPRALVAHDSPEADDAIVLADPAIARSEPGVEENLEPSSKMNGAAPHAETPPERISVTAQTARFNEIGMSSFDSDELVLDLRDTESSLIELKRSIPTDARILTSAEGILGASRTQLLAKRVLDVVGAGLGIILFSPLMLLSALIVWSTSSGPALFVQTRTGRNGKTFRMVKFRTMYNGAEGERTNLELLNEQDGPVFKIRRDPRITRAGYFIRRLSLDELPQLFHVVSGKMSLVGPRPPTPDEVSTYNGWELQRLNCKPGLTCTWQISGRSDIDFQTWVKLDIDYIGDWTPFVDIRLIAKTPLAIIRRRGAY